MFELQIAMQTGSQYLEACSNVLSAVHQSMMSMARATKGRWTQPVVFGAMTVRP